MKIISLGAGIQSTCLYWMSCHGKELERADLAIFADTGDEPKYVMDNLEHLKTGIIPIEVVSVGNIYQDIINSVNDKLRPAKIPLFVISKDGKRGMLKRQCTVDYKIIPIRRCIRRHTGGKSCELWIGITVDEIHRMRESGVKYIKNRYPLIDIRMRRNDCVNWLIKNGYPIPKKSSCRICPYHSDKYWMNMKEKYPEDFEEVCKLDDSIRNFDLIKNECFLHRSCKPLREIDFYKQKEQLELFEECEGYCGV